MHAPQLIGVWLRFEKLLTNLFCRADLILMHQDGHNQTFESHPVWVDLGIIFDHVVGRFYITLFVERSAVY